MAPDGMQFTLEIKCCCSDVRAQLIALQNQLDQISLPTQDLNPSETAENDINILEEVEEENQSNLMNKMEADSVINQLFY